MPPRVATFVHSAGRRGAAARFGDHGAFFGADREGGEVAFEAQDDASDSAVADQ